MAGLLLPLFVAILAVAGWFVWKAEKKRRAAFGAWAAERGFRYAHQHDASVRAEYGFLDRLQIGHSRRGYHVLRGEWRGRRAAAFQFQYTIGSGKNQHTVRFAVALLHLERPFPELLIGPENFLHRFAGVFGFDDIDFESVEFSRAYLVRCRDKKFAYDFCHTGMMEYLLARRGTSLEQEGGVLALFLDGALEPDALDGMFGLLDDVRGLMPEYLFRS